jgi:hypothetical protein
VLDLALCRRSRGVVDGGINLAEAEGLGLGVCRHGWKGEREELVGGLVSKAEAD